MCQECKKCLKISDHLNEICNNAGVPPNQRRPSHANPSAHPAIGAAFFLLKDIGYQVIFILQKLVG